MTPVDFLDYCRDVSSSPDTQLKGIDDSAVTRRGRSAAASPRGEAEHFGR